MIVRLDVSVLNDPDVFDLLDQLFPLLENGRHQWCVFDEKEVRESYWCKSHNPRWQHRIRVLLDTAKPILANRRSVPTVVVGYNVEPEDNECVLSPTAALRLLNQPLRLVVEDVVSDGAFLRAVLLRFGEKRLSQKLGQQEWDDLKTSWTEDTPGDGNFFRLVHAGGSRVGDVLRREWTHSPVAVVAVVDSDRRNPSQPSDTPRQGSTWHNAVVEAAKVPVSPLKLRPIVHALPRREMENYIPREALKAIYRSNPQKQCFEAYIGMDDNQRHFYDLKRGAEIL